MLNATTKILAVISVTAFVSGGLMYAILSHRDTGGHISQIIPAPITDEASVQDGKMQGRSVEPLPAIHDEAIVPKKAPLLVVSAMGAVQAPGVYRLAKGSRVHDLIQQAGGVTPDADMEDINLAASLIDGTTLTVPEQATRGFSGEKLVVRSSQTAAALNPSSYTRSGWRAAPVERVASIATPASPSGAKTATASDKPDCVDLNNASMEELESLPGIGPKTAEKIMQYRRQVLFRSVEELLSVHGIGPKKLEALRNLICPF